VASDEGDQVVGIEDRNLYGRACGLNERGRHATFASSVSSTLAGMLIEHDDFYDTVVAAWPTLGAGLAMRPGRFSDGKIFLYVKSGPAMFAMRAKLPALKARLAALPGAPKRIELRLEIHTS